MNYVHRYTLHRVDGLLKHNTFSAQLPLKTSLFLLDSSINIDNMFSKIEITEIIFDNTTELFRKRNSKGFSSVESLLKDYHRVFPTQMDALIYAEALKVYCIEVVKKAKKHLDDRLFEMSQYQPK